MDIENETDLQRAAADGQTHVFLFASPSHIPFNFAAHIWFVVAENGTWTRWEVLYQKHQCETSWGYLHQNALPAHIGMQILPPLPFRWRKKLLVHVRGEDAVRIARVLKEAPVRYPFVNRYHLSGPNSNTFASWVLRHVPSVHVELPNNAIGKAYPLPNIT